jgi:hypothetical protein
MDSPSLNSKEGNLESPSAPNTSHPPPLSDSQSGPDTPLPPISSEKSPVPPSPNLNIESYDKKGINQFDPIGVSDFSPTSTPSKTLSELEASSKINEESGSRIDDSGEIEAEISLFIYPEILALNEFEYDDLLPSSLALLCIKDKDFFGVFLWKGKDFDQGQEVLKFPQFSPNILFL